MIASITGIAGKAVSFHLDRYQDKGAASLDDEEFAKGLGKHSRHSSAEESKEKEAKKSNELTPEQKEQVKELKKRDAQVRTHEMAHMAAAGSLARGGPNYTYQTGPDGRSYAIGGHVQIDTSPGRTPEETLAKAAQMQSAAVAPSDPSPQDMKVAAAAARLAADALQELSKNSDEENELTGPGISRVEHEYTFKFSSEIARFNGESGEDKESEEESGSTPINRLIRSAYSASTVSPEDEEHSFNATA